mgnify:CR=1 FL=1
MEVIKKAFIQIHNKNVPIYGVQSKDLKDFTTTEKDIKKGISRFPLENQRVRSEDLPQLLMAAFADQVQVDVTEGRKEPVGVVSGNDCAAVGDVDRVVRGGVSRHDGDPDAAVLVLQRMALAVFGTPPRPEKPHQG